MTIIFFCNLRIHFDFLQGNALCETNKECSDFFKKELTCDKGICVKYGNII